MSLINFRYRFLARNLLKGLGFLSVIVLVYVLLQKLVPLNDFLDYIGRWPLLVYFTYLTSEVIFGIIPPELYMIWSIKHGLFNNYAMNVLLLATISYLAGVVGYFIGVYASHIPFLETPIKKHINRYHNVLSKYGGFLIVVGAITPLPFSAICMLMGAIKFRFSSFLLITCTRFARFAVYGYVIYQANIS